LCPFGSLPPLRIVRERTEQAGQPEAKAIAYSYPLGEGIRPPSPPFFKRPGGLDTVMFEARLTRGILVSADCVALEKAKNQQASGLKLTEAQRKFPWHVMPLRPWPSDGEIARIPRKENPAEFDHIKYGDLIAGERVNRAMEIPERLNADGAVAVERAYVDLRYLTPLKPDHFEGMVRLASLSDAAVRRLWAKIFTFFSGVLLPEALTCPKCAAGFTMAELVTKNAIAD
jgi:hypothetical protein